MDMLHPVPDDLWGKACLAYHFQPSLGPESRSALKGLQQTIASQWPNALHLCPPEAFHVTIYPLVPVTGHFDKGAYWNSISEPSLAILDEVCTGRDALDLKFFRVKVTETAIIAIARDETGLIQDIRKKVLEAIPPPPGCQSRRYDLVHSTLARYRSPDRIPAPVIGAIETLPVAFSAAVERIRIVRETRFPCLATDEIASIPLVSRAITTTSK